MENGHRVTDLTYPPGLKVYAMHGTRGRCRGLDREAAWRALMAGKGCEWDRVSFRGHADGPQKQRPLHPCLSMVQS